MAHLPAQPTSQKGKSTEVRAIGRIRIRDRALTLPGGAGYLSSHPLSQAYRDVRAGSFMQPLGRLRAYDFIGKAALGLEPTLT